MKKYHFLTYIILSFLSAEIIAQNYDLHADSMYLDQVELREVVIKASKDNVTYRSIPASVSVMSSADLYDNEIRTLSSVTATAANFFMPEYGSKLTSPVYIRGIGSRINSPSVGLYVDYVPYFEKAAFGFDFFDIKKIEILRGPQGTLFGRNTMGGIINIVTLSPVDYSGTRLNISAGSYGTVSTGAGYYGKLGKKTSFSLAVNYLHNDGFYTNEFTGKQVDRLNSYGIRNRIIVEASEKLTIENIAGLEMSYQGGYPYAIFNDSTKTPEKINYNQYSSYDRVLFSDALLVRYNHGSFEVTSTSSYQYLDDIQNIDQDFTVDSLFFVAQTQKQHMLSQEIIARSSGSRKYNWLFGAYGFYQAFDNGVGVDAWAQKMDYLKEYDHSISGAALFHQSSLSDFIFRNLTLTAGLRVDTENDRLGYFYDRTFNGNYSVVSDTLYPSLRSLEIIPRFAINYRTANTDFYAVIARGYKTGGFNSTFERPEDLTFSPEFSWNYEAGIKSSFSEKKLHADLAVFYINWKNQQIYQTVPSGRGSMLKNAGHSVSRGVEVSLGTAPLRGFEFDLAYGLTDARFISYVLNESTDYNGNRLPYVPRNTIALGAAKTIFITGFRPLEKIRINARYRGTGSIYWNEENTYSQPYYGITDLKVSLIKGDFQLDIWAKNLMNTEYSSFFFEALGNRYVQTGRPFQTGINLSANF